MKTAITLAIAAIWAAVPLVVWISWNATNDPTLPLPVLVSLTIAAGGITVALLDARDW